MFLKTLYFLGNTVSPKHYFLRNTVSLCSTVSTCSSNHSSILYWEEQYLLVNTVRGTIFSIRQRGTIFPRKNSSGEQDLL